MLILTAFIFQSGNNFCFLGEFTVKKLTVWLLLDLATACCTERLRVQVLLIAHMDF